MTIKESTECIKEKLEVLAGEYGVLATREDRLFGDKRRHATDVCWRDTAGSCLIRFEVDSRGEQAEWNEVKPFSDAMDVDHLPAHFVLIRFDVAARSGALRPVAHLVAGLPLPPDYMHSITVDAESPSLLADLRQDLWRLLTVLGPTGKVVDDVFSLLKPYQLLVCEGRLDLAVIALERRIGLHDAQDGSPVQRPLHVIALARLLQQAGWLAKARRYVKIARKFGRDSVPATAWDFLNSVDWKINIAEQEDWRLKAFLLNSAERSTRSLCAPFIWRQVLAETHIGRSSRASEHLKRYQGHVGSGTDDHVGSGTGLYKQSVSTFLEAQERFLSGEVDEAVKQSGILADVELQMLCSPDEQPTASLNATIAAEALRAIALCAKSGEVSDHVVKLLRELLSAGERFGIGVNAESLSDISLPWPRTIHAVEARDRCMPPSKVWLRDPILSNPIRQLSAIHWKLSKLQQAV